MFFFTKVWLPSNLWLLAISCLLRELECAVRFPAGVVSRRALSLSARPSSPEAPLGLLALRVWEW